MNVSKLNSILGGALVGQLALVAATWWPDSGSTTEAVAIVQMPRDEIDAITITAGGEDAESVQLERSGEGWVVASAEGYPAQADKVDELLGKLEGLKVRRPVATQPTSHPSLKVAEDDFGRKIEVTDEGQTTTFFVGAARSNVVNVRRAGEDEVYEAKGVSEFGFQNTARGYYDTLYVSTDEETIDSLTIARPDGSLSLVRTESGWMSGEQPLAQAEVDKLLRKVGKVRMAEPVGTEVLPEHGLDGSTRIEWTATADNETTSHALLVGAETDSKRYIKAPDRDFVVTIWSSSLKPLLEAKLEDLVAAAD